MNYKAYILTFDKNEKIGTPTFHTTLTEAKGIETWWHYLESTYILVVEDNISATNITDFIIKVAPECYFFVSGLNLKEHNGWLPQKAWDWINEQNKYL